MYDTFHCLPACLGKRVKHEPYAGAGPSQLADCGHQARSETNGAGSSHSRAGGSRAQTQGRCAQTTGDKCTRLPPWKAQTSGKHAALATTRDVCQQA